MGIEEGKREDVNPKQLSQITRTDRETFCPTHELCQVPRVLIPGIPPHKD